jgi:hypothetical protein
MLTQTVDTAMKATKRRNNPGDIEIKDLKGTLMSMMSKNTASNPDNSRKKISSSSKIQNCLAYLKTKKSRS